MIEALSVLAQGIGDCCGAGTWDYARPLIVGAAIVAGVLFGGWLAVRGWRRG